MLCFVASLLALPRPTPEELETVSSRYSAGLAAAQKWDYYRAYLIFTNVANKRKGREREDAKNWILKIERILMEVEKHYVSSHDTWESIALQYFHDSSLASRLAAFNRSSIVDCPEEWTIVNIPRVHLEAYLGFSTFDDPKTAPIDSLLIGIRHMKAALDIDPDYPELREQLEWAKSAYHERAVDVQVDSLEKSAELEAAMYEYTRAIQLLEKAQEISPNENRAGRISRLKQRRIKYLPILFELGNECFWKDDLRGALKAWRKVAEVNPNFRDVRNRIIKAQRMLQLLDGIEDTPKQRK